MSDYDSDHEAARMSSRRGPVTFFSSLSRSSNDPLPSTGNDHWRSRLLFTTSPLLKHCVTNRYERFSIRSSPESSDSTELFRKRVPTHVSSVIIFRNSSENSKIRTGQITWNDNGGKHGRYRYRWKYRTGGVYFHWRNCADVLCHFLEQRTVADTTRACIKHDSR